MTERTCRLRGAAALLSLLSLLPAPLAAAPAAPAEVLAAAAEGLPRFLAAVSDADARRLGFESRAAAGAAGLARGFLVHTVTPEALEAGGGIDRLAVPTGLWQFVVVSGGKAASLLTVDRVDGRWTAVSLGASGLAAQLDAAGQAWPESAGYALRLVRVYQAASDLVEVSRAGLVAGVLPLVSARVALGLAPAFDAGDLLVPEAALEGLRPAVRANLEQQVRP